MVFDKKAYSFLGTNPPSPIFEVCFATRFCTSCSKFKINDQIRSSKKGRNEFRILLRWIEEMIINKNPRNLFF